MFRVKHCAALQSILTILRSQSIDQDSFALKINYSSTRFMLRFACPRGAKGAKLFSQDFLSKNVFDQVFCYFSINSSERDPSRFSFFEESQPSWLIHPCRKIPVSLVEVSQINSETVIVNSKGVPGSFSYFHLRIELSHGSK